MAAALTTTLGENAPAPKIVGGYRLGDVRHVVASAERARTVLGFEAEIGFDEGMREFARVPLRSGRQTGTLSALIPGSRTRTKGGLTTCNWW